MKKKAQYYIREQYDRPVSKREFLQKKEQEIAQKAEQVRRDAEEKLYLMGKFDPAQRADFILVPEQYTIFDVNDMYLRRETF